jgi:exonuclease III
MATPCAAQQDNRTDPSRLVIMTLNAEFLWDGIEPEEGQVDFPWKDSPTEADDHMREIAEVIIRNNPDIVTLVEVEGSEALERLNTEFLAGRGYIAYLVKGLDTYTGQDVGFLSRIEATVTRYDEYGVSGDTRKRVSKNFVATLSASNREIAFVGLHFLSGPNRTDRREQRQAQADAMRQVAQAHADSNRAVVVLGDFNDYDGEVGSIDHNDNMPITTVLAQIKALDPADPADDLVNVASFLPKAQRYTAHWDQDDDLFVDAPGELSSIDHILLSQSLADLAPSVTIDQTHDPLRVSDHFPVVVTLQLDEPAAPTAGVWIRSLVPDPAGNDRQNESVTVVNLGDQQVDLRGWTLRDLAGTTWSLDALGRIDPGEEKTIQRRGQAMALNNRGDTVELVDDEGRVVDTVTYGRVDRDEVVVTGR